MPRNIPEMTSRITFYLSPDQSKKIRQAAAKHKGTLSSFVRRTVLENLTKVTEETPMKQTKQ